MPDMENMLLGDSSDEDDDDDEIQDGANVTIPIARHFADAVQQEQQENQKKQQTPAPAAPPVPAVPPPAPAPSIPSPAPAVPRPVIPAAPSASAPSNRPGIPPAMTMTGPAKQAGPTRTGSIGTPNDPPSLANISPAPSTAPVNPSEIANRLRNMYAPSKKTIDAANTKNAASHAGPVAARADNVDKRMSLGGAGAPPPPSSSGNNNNNNNNTATTTTTNRGTLPPQNTNNIRVPSIPPMTPATASSRPPTVARAPSMGGSATVGGPPDKQRPSTSSTMPSGRGGNSDFEPTPLQSLIHRGGPAPGQGGQGRGPPPPGYPPGAGGMAPGGRPSMSQQYSSTASPASPSKQRNPPDRAALEEEARKRKEKFLMFTRVLMKYLEQKDRPMHAKAKEVIKECADKNKNKDPEYQSLTLSMQRRLRATVGEAYWKKAEDYLNHFIRQKMQGYAKKNQVGMQHHQANHKAMQQQQHQQHQQQQQQQQQPSHPSNIANSNMQSKHPSSNTGQPQTSYQPNIPGRSYKPNIPKTPDEAMIDQQFQRLQKKIQQDRLLQASQQKSKHAPAPAVPPVPAMQPKPPAKKAPAKGSRAKGKQGEKKGKGKAGGNQGMATQQADPKAAQKYSHVDQRKKEALAIALQLPPKATRNITPTNSQLPMTAPTPLPPASVPGVTDPAANLTHMKKQQEKKKPQKKNVPGKAHPVQAGMEAHKPEPPPREYNEFMEMVDHAVDYNWKNAGLLLSKEFVKEVSLDEEQKKLLYGGRKSPEKSPHAVPPSLQTARTSPSLALRGWSRKNLITSRVAWAKIRLPEEEKRNKPATSSWYNDEKAETDPALALLSEATEMYLKSLLEGAVTAARQRQNIDGIRLWHMQHAHVAGTKPPPLSLRLGCDVNRQVALVDGNAAKTVRRMEQALSRNVRRMNLDDDNVLYNAATMEELSKGPVVEKAVEKADHDAKRSFEVFGGKGSGAPPFGRVPKRCKLTVKDLRFAIEDPGFIWKTRCVRATGFI